jgi:hypothetical protein
VERVEQGRKEGVVGFSSSFRVNEISNEISKLMILNNTKKVLFAQVCKMIF